MIGTGGSFDFLARRYVRPSDFAEAGGWQSFDVDFTLADVTRDVEFRIDFEGVTELRASTIQVRRVTPAEDPLPVFAALFLSLIGPGDKARFARLPDQLAAAGVV